MSYKLQLNKDYEYFEEDLLNIREIFANAEGSIHKARNELKIIKLHGLECVIKSFKIPHIINRVAYTFFRDSKSKKSFTNGLKLQKLQVNTPEPIAVIEFFKIGLLERSYFISLYKPYEFTIREVFHHKVNNVEAILKEFARFTYELHKKGVWHVDYSLGNILINKKATGYDFSLVDINRMEFKVVPPKEGLKNFNKFWAKYDTDLPIIAKEYAKVADIDENEAIKIVVNEAKKLEDMVNIKRKIKEKL